ncbi:TPA: hypothetical protein QB198_002597 [Pasteurella multocida]|nr:hypothetical protein I141_10750 [Pasteurella multocida P1933]HDR1425384.1 hypothetical protein [Pasteurella multocida]
MPNEFPHPAYLMLKAGLQSELIVLLFHQLASLSPDAAGQALHDFSTIADNIDDYLCQTLDESAGELTYQLANEIFDQLFEILSAYKEKAQSTPH